MKKRILFTAAILCVSLAFLAICGVFSFAEVSTGACGDALTWTFDSGSGELTVSGSGPMWDYSTEEHPLPEWNDLSAGIKKISVEDGVTSVGAYAFHRLDALAEADLANSVTGIGSHAFYECKLLEKIGMPEGLTAIGKHAFYGCRTLTEIEIPAGVASIGEYAFFECRGLLSAAIPAGVRSLEDCTFGTCTSLTNVTLPDGLTHLRNSVFQKCSSLEEIKLPESLVYIGLDVFSECSSLKSIVVPDGVTTLSAGVFSGCESLVSAVIPEAITVLDARLFQSCRSLSDLTVKGEITEIGRKTFQACSSLTDFRIPATVTKLDQFAFYGAAITEATIPEAITVLNDGVFQNCFNLKSIVIPDNVVSIGEYAFNGDYQLAEVTIGEKVEWLMMGAFNECYELATVRMPASVKRIDMDAFCSCESLETVYYGGVKPQWEAITVAEGNEPLLAANIVMDEPFTDVPSGAWYENGALYCYAHGLMNGTSETTFAPNAKLNRAMFVTILAKIDGADVEGYETTSFADVAAGKWYTKTVEWAYKSDYTSGVGTDAATGKPIFGWNQNVTRQQLAVFLYNYSQKKGYDVSELADISKYTDAGDVSGWAVTGVRWAIASGMISGTSETTISPKKTATRAQVALIVMNYVENITK